MNLRWKHPCRLPPTGNGGRDRLSRFASRVLGTVILTAALLVGSQRSASAGFEYQWMGLPIGGAATSIAVGPNNILWVVGTDGNVYYLTPTSSCGPGVVCQPTYVWTEMGGLNGTAAQISVSLNGSAYVLDTGGNIYALVSDCNSGTTEPGSSFAIMNTTQTLSSIAVTSITGPPAGQLPEEFVTQCDFQWEQPYFKIPVVWGIGPHWPGYEGYVYENTVPFGYYFPDPLTPMQVAPGPAAPAGLTITLFNNPGPPATQTAWITTSNQVLWTWNNAQDAFVQAPGFGSILTDHFVLGTDGNVYEWSDAIGNWQPSPVAPPTPGGAIGGLAYSQAIENTFIGTIGPSELWAFDANTKEIYYAVPVLPPPR
jgi:hypothetical protein